MNSPLIRIPKKHTPFYTACLKKQKKLRETGIEISLFEIMMRESGKYKKEREEMKILYEGFKL